ncbi:hypothetical protein OEZ85_012134 [Tetradesmus obliquus]|uniref:Phospholipid-transporting ATPase n=1 Tax=Tetradesmus obliquus TaxID=3088 RepID=A0ABY8TSG7_TETOB|nr:hypothetical protein OEZ85_012134 [Tetradesmus obliquus]
MPPDVKSRQPFGCSWLKAWSVRHHVVPDRVVQFPPEQQHKLHALEKSYAGNKTTTTKYSLLTFIPKSLFEQYRRVANIYFTLVAALSLTPYSPVRPWTTFLPLGIVLGAAMIKEAVEDYRRHKQDVEVNNRKVQVFNTDVGQFETRTWRDIHVGDIIIVHKGENFPADLLFLSAENEEGICYIETMQLDGETNLKIKKALDETKDLRHHSIGHFAGSVTCEPPNSRLYQFTGKFEAMPPLVQAPCMLPLSPAAMLLRGCSLCNTHRIYGLVIYAGHDTKIFMNSTQPPSKRSRIERTVDRIIFFMFGLLFSMCLTGCIYFAWWTARYMPDHWYLGGDSTLPREYDGSKPGVVAVTNFITAFILYGYLIPIALYVSIEMVKVVQSMCFIGLDRSMYHPDTDTPAVARTSNLNEELGMVNTILSDKTGTLTRNVMEFFKCSIGGVAYGAGVTEIERNNAERRGLKLDVADEETDNKFREPFFNFYDDRLMGLEWSKQPNTELTCQFFRLLALCHTVIPEGPPIPEQIRYEAESPDEAALVVAAKVFGFFLVKRTNTIITLRERLPDCTRETEYEILNILEFNSTRKRMSVIIRTPENKIILYCKGADTVVYERLDRKHPLNDQLKEVTLQHMEEFGSAGLRTLCLAYTELDPRFYDEWNERFIEAKLSMVDRAAKVDAVGEQVEKNLRLLGCTAIEDKLQEGVPQCIKTLAQAGIRLWVLTGDKMETAINIGYACSLITDEMTQFQLTGSCADVDLLEAEGRMDEATQLSVERLESQLNKVARTMEEDAAANIGMQYALVIDGKALLYALSPRLRQQFLMVGIKCAAVLCCRVSPLQKAQVTALVKTWGDTTLAIGDGANDVGMIQKAHIGVGISGQEGMQATMASDFAIAQFRFLTPLLLVHGRLSYKRITRMISFFFYKNLFYGSTIFIYNAFALFSGQPIYNDFYMTLFNVVFTAAAPLVVGWFDRDLDKDLGLRFPFLYHEGQQNLYFDLPAIVGWLGMALLHAAMTVAMVLVGSDSQESDRHSGAIWSLQQNGLLMFTTVVITVHLQLGMVIDQWTWMHHLSIWGSILLWFLFLIAYGAFPIRLSSDLHRAFDSIAASPNYWLTIFVVPLACLLPVFFFRALKRHLRPARYQLVQEIVERQKRGEDIDLEDYADERNLGRSKAQIKGIMARASRLVQRKVLRQTTGARGRHKGFVPPYNTQSRVFDINELRNAATQVGYSISASGDMVPAPHGQSFVSNAPGHGSVIGQIFHRASGNSLISGTGSLPVATHSATGGLFGRNSVTSLTGTASGPAALGMSALPGGFVSMTAEAGDGGSSPRASMLQAALHGPAGTLTGGSLTGTVASGAGEAVPPVEGFVTNPVLANLELAFSQDPRRHRRKDSQLSSLSIGSLHRLRAGSSGGSSRRSSLEPGGSPGGASAASRGSADSLPQVAGEFSGARPRSPEQQQVQHSAAGAASSSAGQQHGQAGQSSRLGRLPVVSVAAAAADDDAQAGAASSSEQPQGNDDPDMLQLYTAALQRPSSSKSQRKRGG